MSDQLLRSANAVCDLDAEIDSLLAGPVGAANPADDQATRLRAMVAGSGGPSPAATSLAAAEAVLRSVLERREIDRARERAQSRTHLARVVAVASGKGGVGKTNIAVNLAAAMAARGLRVILLDADLGTANADVLCGLTPTARLDHVVTPLPLHDGAAISISDILVDAPGGFRLAPGSAGIARMADLTPGEQRQMLELLGELERDADVLVVDTGAGVGRSVTTMLHAADLGLVVATPEPTSMADAYALLKCLVLSEEHEWSPGSAEALRMVINQSVDSGEAEDVHARLTAVCGRFLGIRPKLLGSIAQDLRVAQAVRARCPLVLYAPECPAARHMVLLASRLIDQLGVRVSQSRPNASPGFRAALARILLRRHS
ncbi:MAG: P-loop NTPase [Phycisphaeraceae bacterium]|nr:P-loop NTPase [Phycisphaeraceae bacterium]